MILRETVVVRDEYGNGLSNRTVIAYPTGTILNEITATEIGNGVYTFVLDSSSLTAAQMARYYDIYVSGDLKQSKKSLGIWEWVAAAQELTSVEQTFNFTDLVDADGIALPATMPSNVGVAIERAWVDAVGYISSVTTTSFTVKISGFVEEGVTPKFDFRIYLK